MSRARAGAAAAGAAVAAMIIAGAVMMSPDRGAGGGDPVFHATLADPGLYVNGSFSRDVRLEPGEHRFKFTPNGDSPQILSVGIRGESFSFEEDFELEGTLHDTGISQYHTWEYLGEDRIEVPGGQDATITIDPNGNLLGPVSVSLLRLPQE